MLKINSFILFFLFFFFSLNSYGNFSSKEILEKGKISGNNSQYLFSLNKGVVDNQGTIIGNQIKTIYFSTKFAGLNGKISENSPDLGDVGTGDLLGESNTGTKPNYDSVLEDILSQSTIKLPLKNGGNYDYNIFANSLVDYDNYISRNVFNNDIDEFVFETNVKLGEIKLSISVLSILSFDPLVSELVNKINTQIDFLVDKNLKLKNSKDNFGNYILKNVFGFGTYGYKGNIFGYNNNIFSYGSSQITGEQADAIDKINEAKNEDKQIQNSGGNNKTTKQYRPPSNKPKSDPMTCDPRKDFDCGCKPGNSSEGCQINNEKPFKERLTQFCKTQPYLNFSLKKSYTTNESILYTGKAKLNPNESLGVSLANCETKENACNNNKPSSNIGYVSYTKFQISPPYGIDKVTLRGHTAEITNSTTTLDKCFSIFNKKVIISELYEDDNRYKNYPKEKTMTCNAYFVKKSLSGQIYCN